MKNNKKISTRELKLLFVFFTLLILYASYQFGYLKYTNKTEKLMEESRTLENQLSELKKKDSNKEKMIKETEEFNKKKDSMLEEFPAGVTEEKITMFVVDMENYAGAQVSTISFDGIQAFYSPDIALSGDTTEEEANTATESTADVNITGYQTTVLLSYQATYAGLKKCIDYINTYKEKINIGGLTATFDSTSGNLTGTITFIVYSLSGTDKKYQAPQIAGIEIGRENIFGTFEIPLHPEDSLATENE